MGFPLEVRRTRQETNSLTKIQVLSGTQCSGRCCSNITGSNLSTFVSLSRRHNRNYAISGQVFKGVAQQNRHSGCISPTRSLHPPSLRPRRRGNALHLVQRRSHSYHRTRKRQLDRLRWMGVSGRQVYVPHGTYFSLETTPRSDLGWNDEHCLLHRLSIRHHRRQFSTASSSR